MKIVIRSLAVSCLIVTLTACSKKDEATSELNTPTTADASTNAPQLAYPVATATIQSLPDVSKAIQGGQYETAVQTLVQMKPATAQMTDAQRLQYQQAVRDATTVLISVKDRNPAAQAAYDKLSRSATGR